MDDRLAKQTEAVFGRVHLVLGEAKLFYRECIVNRLDFLDTAIFEIALPEFRDDDQLGRLA